MRTIATKHRFHFQNLMDKHDMKKNEQHDKNEPKRTETHQSAPKRTVLKIDSRQLF